MKRNKENEIENDEERTIKGREREKKEGGGEKGKRKMKLVNKIPDKKYKLVSCLLLIL